ncbi:uncharacterized protein RCC_07864 [Ramularia collo-cygni]|uniref:Uncharacterized protein n=1 Tax=Ramularia collo-cygni TaxID=112498 RepID=A0A2D3V5N6_9PEZI|nr:uncharacterized protein RCC_07864 [Ramularia collo-cygni]CZT21995.1 uncharacterized protein RCC_07864 [Ramularia collo-cygni]
MNPPPTPERGVMLAAAFRRVAGTGASVKTEVTPKSKKRPSQVPPPSAATPAPIPGMGVMDLTRSEVNPAVSRPATQYHNIIVVKAQHTRLINLPEAVRTRIFRLAMISHLPVQIKRRPFPAEPNLLFTCKQIRKEAQLIFWTESRFQGRDAVYVCTNKARAPQVLYQRQLSVLLEWLDRIGKEKAQLIKRLQIDYDEDCQFNTHPGYQSNWPATAEDVMNHKKLGLTVAARYAAIKIVRGLLFHGVSLDAIKPVPILKGALRAGQGDQFGALWKLSIEEVIALLRAH